MSRDRIYLGWDAEFTFTDATGASWTSRPGSTPIRESDPPMTAEEKLEVERDAARRRVRQLERELHRQRKSFTEDLWRVRAERDRAREELRVARQGGGRGGLDLRSSTFLTKLIRLCHPDRHGGSRLSNEMTAYLLELRAKARGSS